MVLPVYHRVPPEQFDAALASVLSQTQPASEVIIVADGPLTPELDAIIDAQSQRDASIQVVRLPENRGVAHAMQAGLEAATQPWVARQDSDDISLPERFERMWPRLERGDLSMLGAAMYEFEGEPDNVVGIRAMPLEPRRVAAYCRFNNPVNNPTSIMHRERALAVGGVRPVLYMEDWDLIARLLAAGYTVANLPEPLVRFRADPGMFSRRRDRRLLSAEWQMQRGLRSYGLISAPRMVVNFVVRSAASALPSSWFKRAYAAVFRRGGAPEVVSAA